jgi:hypothetical protein
MRRIAALFLAAATAAAAPAAAVVIDRVAATVEGDVITVTAVDQMIALSVYPQRSDEDEAAYRRRVLDAMISHLLRFRDVERFGAQEVSRDAVEARVQAILGRFGSPEAFAAELERVEVSLDELRAILTRQLQVAAYIDERFSPTIFVSLEEIERYYSENWIPQRRSRGLAVEPLGEVREQIREILKAERLEAQISRWTEELRSRANVDVFVYR